MKDFMIKDNRFGKLSSKLIGKNKPKSKESFRALKEGDFVSMSNKIWKVFAITDSGMVTLQNSQAGGVPASLVVTPSQAKLLMPLMKCFKT